jgi:hypothetical protein
MVGTAEFKTTFADIRVVVIEIVIGKSIHSHCRKTELA